MGGERVRVSRGLRAGTRGGWRGLGIKEIVGCGVRIRVLNRDNIRLGEGEHSGMSFFQGSFKTRCNNESCVVLKRREEGMTEGNSLVRGSFLQFS